MLGMSKTIDCVDSMDISAVADIYAQLSEIEPGHAVTLKASNVERIDTAMLQMLTTFFKDAPGKEITIKWKKPSEAIFQSARLLGLEQHLQLADV